MVKSNCDKEAVWVLDIYSVIFCQLLLTGSLFQSVCCLEKHLAGGEIRLHFLL